MAYPEQRQKEYNIVWFFNKRQSAKSVSHGPAKLVLYIRLYTGFSRDEVTGPQLPVVRDARHQNLRSVVVLGMMGVVSREIFSLA